MVSPNGKRLARLIAFSFCCLNLEDLNASIPEAEKAIAEGDYKNAIVLYQNLLKNQPFSETSEPLELGLALAFLKDQNQEMAFKTFLGLLEKKSLSNVPVLKPEEEASYQKALKIYLDKSSTPQEIAKKILADFSPDSQIPPLAFIQASAYANLNQYDRFFSLFYRSYKECPDHFLADKTKAVLHMKLFERCPLNSEREFHRRAILSHLSKAADNQPCDDSLYKFMILFAPEQEKAGMLRACLNKIIERNIVISRSDISFYTKEAVEAKELSLAQKFVDAAREWYQFSKVVNAAQQYLDNHKHN